jgi:all-trans-retinol 13,14-reductase
VAECVAYLREVPPEFLALAALLVAVAILILGKQWLRYQHHGCVPRGYRSHKFTSTPVTRSAGQQIHRDNYTKKKVPEDIDVIVIGSGIGGLTCAGLLSRVGKRCLVLEQHYIAGGCTHCFEEHGYEFDTGVHYVGNIHRRQKYFDLVTKTPLVWDQMGNAENGFLYDEVVVGGGHGEAVHEYKLRAGVQQYIDELASHFPDERAAIEGWVALVQKVRWLVWT